MSRALFALLSLAILTVELVSAQEPDYTLKIDVPVVTVEVTVQDARGQLAGNLSSNAFEVYEDGTRQEIRYFAPVSTPYNILLLFDRSGSTQDQWPLMQRAVAGFILTLRAQDKVAIGAFDYDLQMQRDWTGNRNDALSALPRLLEPGHIGGTNLYGAVEDALKHGFGKASGRRALVVLTDGRDTSFYKDLVNRNRIIDIKAERPFQAVLKAARSLHIPIYFVAFNTDKNLQPGTTGGDEYRNLKIIFPNSDMPERYLTAVRLRMEELSDASGGWILYPKDLDDIIPLYRDIGRDLGTSYSLGYVSSGARADGSFRRIEVRTKEPGYRVVQSRAGYYSR